MPIVSQNGLSFSGLVWTLESFKLLPGKQTRPTYSMLGHSTLPFRGQNIVS